MSTGLKTIKIFLSYWKLHPWLAAGSFLTGPAYAAQAIIAPLFIAKILGQLAGHRPISSSYIWLAASSLFGGAILWYLIDNYVSAKLDILTIYQIHKTNLNHLMQQEYSFFTNNFGGSLVAQANRFERAYELFHFVLLLDIVGQLTAVLIAIGIMIFYNPLIGLSVAAFWALSLLYIIRLGIKRMPVRRHAVAADTQQTGELADVVTNAVTVKSFASEGFEASRYDRINLERSKRYTKSWSVGIRNGATIQIMCGVLQLMVVVGGIRAVQNGSIALATFLLFEVYVLRIIDSLGKSSLFVRQFEGLLGDAHEMTELLERQPLVKDNANPELSHLKSGVIEFKNVTFHYPEQHSEESLFERFSLKINAGEHVGLVGPSGGGKTTITRLLLRFYDINGGSITIDGQDIAAIKQSDLHRFVGYVPQEPLLFHRSLAENIGYGSKSTAKEIQDTARRAHADEFIESLPNGYRTLVGERGVKLSGGQRQRVAIARAMLKDAPILILDEATSALDSESEKLVQDALWKLMENKTALVIAHRLSTIQRMDRIVVLDQGKIVEEGKHADLLKNNGLYAKLWKHQSGGFLEE